MERGGINSGLDDTRGLTENKIFSGERCGARFHLFVCHTESVDGFEPDCISIAKCSLENVVLGWVGHGTPRFGGSATLDSRLDAVNTGTES
jgi:hypothetical protein